MNAPDLSTVENVLRTLAGHPDMQKALRYLEEDEARSFAELQEMAVVPGPTFEEEAKRGPMYKAKLERDGVDSCYQDAVGNVIGCIDGAAPRPKVMFDAHMDTVFPMEAALAVKDLGGGRYNCPGMADNTAGMAMNLSVLRAIRHAGLKPQGRLMIVGSVRHEGEGDLQGMKTLFAEDKEIDACFCLETLDKPGGIINTAIGVHRYELELKGPGGHSWLDFGRPSPVQALCRAGAALSDFVPPAEPKTSFNLGTVQGGTTVNSIPAECRAKLDIRSVSAQVLNDTDARIQDIMRKAVAEENARWAGEPISLSFRCIGDRPAGAAPAESLIVRVAAGATEAVGLEPILWPPLGSNANIPMSLGIPSLCLGGGGTGGALHSLNEWYSPQYSAKHAGRLLLALFAMAGLHGATEPLAGLMQR